MALIMIDWAWPHQEGELRPQLLDRFGLSVNVETLQDTEQRTQLVLDRLAYEQDPDALCETARPAQVCVGGNKAPIDLPGEIMFVDWFAVRRAKDPGFRTKEQRKS